jgi:hypothetical protein
MAAAIHSGTAKWLIFLELFFAQRAMRIMRADTFVSSKRLRYGCPFLGAAAESPAALAD